jgi:hypothetical protein
MQAHTQILLIAASLNKRQNQTFNAPWLTLGMGDRTLGTQLIPIGNGSSIHHGSRWSKSAAQFATGTPWAQRCCTIGHALSVSGRAASSAGTVVRTFM